MGTGGFASLRPPEPETRRTTARTPWCRDAGVTAGGRSHSRAITQTRREDVEHFSFTDRRVGERSVGPDEVEKSKPSSVRTAQLQPLRAVHLPPSKPLISRRTYLLVAVGRLIFRSASRLDAVSASPVPT